MWFNGIPVTNFQDDRSSISARKLALEYGHTMLPNRGIDSLPYVLIELVWLIQHPQQETTNLRCLNIVEAGNGIL